METLEILPEYNEDNFIMYQKLLYNVIDVTL